MCYNAQIQIQGMGFVFVSFLKWDLKRNAELERRSRGRGIPQGRNLRSFGFFLHISDLYAAYFDPYTAKKYKYADVSKKDEY